MDGVGLVATDDGRGEAGQCRLVRTLLLRTGGVIWLGEEADGLSHPHRVAEQPGTKRGPALQQ